MFLSGGAAAMNLSLAAQALGYGANWITNWYSDSEEGRAILGLKTGRARHWLCAYRDGQGRFSRTPAPGLENALQRLCRWGGRLTDVLRAQEWPRPAA
jgi:hypothetical protein